MKMGTAAIFLLSLMLIVTGGLAQQLDYNITGAGARAAGMGGAFIGVADDATAIVWNPAGLTQLERTEASIVARGVTESVDYKNSADPTLNESVKQTHGVLNFGSIAFPFRLGTLNTVVAVAYQRQMDFYAKQKTPGSESEEKGGVDTFSPAIAIQLNPVISVGVTANIWFGSDTYNENDFTSSRRSTMEGKAKGTNFMAGALVDLGALRTPVPLKFGVAVRTPFDLKLTRTLKWEPAISFYDKVEFTTTSQMPLMLGFGASVRPAENLVLALDYEIRKYGNKKEKWEFSDGALQSVLGGEYRMSASEKDLNQIRVGAEYLIVTRAGVFPLRAGYQNVPTLMAEYDANGNVSQVVGNGFAFGTGFISQSFAIDLTASTSSFTLGDEAVATNEIRKSMLTLSLILYF